MCSSFVDRTQVSCLRPLSDPEMDAYCRPDRRRGEGRRSVRSWLRQPPTAGKPADVVEIVRSHGQWRASSPPSHLFVHAEPDSLLTRQSASVLPELAESARGDGPGRHSLQEDSPDQFA
jgi:haloalkane dehalogenase